MIAPACSCVAYYNSGVNKAEIIAAGNNAPTVPSVVTFASDNTYFVGYRAVAEVRHTQPLIHNCVHTAKHFVAYLMMNMYLCVVATHHRWQ